MLSALGYKLDIMNMYADVRIATGVSLLIAYGLHYACFAMAAFKKPEKLERVKFLSRRLWLFGVCAALSTGVI